MKALRVLSAPGLHLINQVPVLPFQGRKLVLVERPWGRDPVPPVSIVVLHLSVLSVDRTVVVGEDVLAPDVEHDRVFRDSDR